MTQSQQTIGHCPYCNTAISPNQILITYTRYSDTAAYAECPTCTDIVRPDIT